MAKSNDPQPPEPLQKEAPTALPHASVALRDVPFGIPWFGTPQRGGQTDFEQYGLNEMVEMVENANPADLEAAGERLYQAARKIQDAAIELYRSKKPIGGEATWAGLGAESARTYTEKLIAHTEKIANFASAAGTQLKAAGEGLASVKNAMPEKDYGVQNLHRSDRQQGTKVAEEALEKERQKRQEAVIQMNKLASHYQVASEGMGEPPPPMKPLEADVPPPLEHGKRPPRGGAMDEGAGGATPGGVAPGRAGDAANAGVSADIGAAGEAGSASPGNAATITPMPDHRVGTDIDSAPPVAPPQPVAPPAGPQPGNAPPVTPANPPAMPGPMPVGPGTGKVPGVPPTPGRGITEPPARPGQGRPVGPRGFGNPQVPGASRPPIGRGPTAIGRPGTLREGAGTPPRSTGRGLPGRPGPGMGEAYGPRGTGRAPGVDGPANPQRSGVRGPTGRPATGPGETIGTPRTAGPGARPIGDPAGGNGRSQGRGIGRQVPPAGRADAPRRPMTTNRPGVIGGDAGTTAPRSGVRGSQPGGRVAPPEGTRGTTRPGVVGTETGGTGRGNANARGISSRPGAGVGSANNPPGTPGKATAAPRGAVIGRGTEANSPHGVVPRGGEPNGASARRAVGDRGGVVGSRNPNDSGRMGLPRTFTEGGTGLVGGRPSAGSESKRDDRDRPNYLVEEEVTWHSGQREAAPRVVEE